MTALTYEQVTLAKSAVAEWLRTRQENGHKDATAADAEHSALLERLLSGKPKLRRPPPLAFSYPCYPLAEGQPYQFTELWERQDGAVVIDQCPDWRWIENTDRTLLLHVPTGNTYKLDGRTLLREVPAPKPRRRKT